MAEHFFDRLTEAVRIKRSPLLVGLDPRWEQLPSGLRHAADEETPIAKAAVYLEFCRGVIAQLKPAWAKERGIELAEQPSEPSRARSFGSRSPRASRLENSRRDAPQGTRQAGLGRKGHA